jgi:methylated-DNA-[protein]-cysteine S-methyltransferase
VTAQLSWTEVQTPIGPFRLVGVGGVVLQAQWRGEPPADAVRDDGALADAAAEVVSYMEGRRTTFDVPVAPAGTPFQQLVWAAMREIPFGETVPYGALAHHLRSEGGARAVGAAAGANPIPLLVPCHRVVGSRGELVGYTSGTDIKSWLIDHERRLSRTGQPPLPLGLHRR